MESNTTRENADFMKRVVLKTAVALLASDVAEGGDFDSRVTHGYADSSGVKIHYASIGNGPLMVMIHGFPDFWYTWRAQMEALSDRFQCVAIDQRGYNLSDQPKGVENYSIRFLVADVAAVIKALGKDKAIIVGHDWGAPVAWHAAMFRPDVFTAVAGLSVPPPFRGRACLCR